MTRSRRRSYGTIRDATAYGGKLSTGDRPTYARPAGVLAWFDGTCSRCDQPIQSQVHQVNRRKIDDWVHIGCMSGADDE